ncbi:MAG: asparagine synthase (glutamine-hydrolyzing) [Cyclobacteriaceae bacterium]|nr:asparagine synthase (glutamine-hydrolyzing) [Cyclobacteriaceae bacterium]
MCGITGVFAFNLVGKFSKINVAAATASLAHRGPDFHDVYVDEMVCLGHRRLSVIDTREVAHQPMWDPTGRWGIVFNGEIFNFKELRESLKARDIVFRTESDTEVLLHLFIHYGEACLSLLNGFFAFCIYDKQDQSFFLARDRYGVKPLYYLHDDDRFLFGSELQSIVAYGIKKDIDYDSLYTYLQLNYIPGPHTIFSAVKKLMPGHWMRVKGRELTLQSYYDIPYDRSKLSSISYADALARLRALLEDAVQRRLVADVPLGTFLSGGIDSSVITALAKKHKPDLHTFSIGFKDEKFFDETAYSQLVAKHVGTKHTAFMLGNAEMSAHLHHILDSIDEPFADSSAIAVYLLSRETRKHVTVALSGDGADELLGGYNKHAAFYRALHPGFSEKAATALRPLWWLLPKSRHAPFSNTVRQLNRYAGGAGLSSDQRYWRWASFATASQAGRMLRPGLLTDSRFNERQRELLSTIPSSETINDILLTDMRLVLPNDMLTKVDRMSMAHGLEIRNPFLDVNVVDFLFTLPDPFKIDGRQRKKLLQDAFRDQLPAELYNRPKKGFEVPLLKWMRKDLKGIIRDELLSKSFIEEQGIFNYPEIRKLKNQLFSISPGDIHARMWGLVAFQWWWRKTVSGKR